MWHLLRHHWENTLVEALFLRVTAVLYVLSETMTDLKRLLTLTKPQFNLQSRNENHKMHLQFLFCLHKDNEKDNDFFWHYLCLESWRWIWFCAGDNHTGVWHKIKSQVSKNAIRKSKALFVPKFIVNELDAADNDLKFFRSPILQSLWFRMKTCVTS